MPFTFYHYFSFNQTLMIIYITILKLQSKKNSQKTKYGYKFTSSDIEFLDDNNFLIIEADYEDAKTNIENVTLKVLNKNEKKILQRIKIKETFYGELSIQNKKNILQLKGTRKTISYEKL